MRSSDERADALFSYFDVEVRPKGPSASVDPSGGRRSPGNTRAGFAALHSRTGRPLIAPETLLRPRLQQAFYLTRFEAVDERPGLDVLLRWFVGFGIDDPAWDHSTFSKNRRR
ncbi:transposase [Ancylobacter tetraedralis]|uniref:transposase n=1 Tax=Ancylobacter tetraedralis TaxID=217068 RepID=UPI003CCCE9F1